MSFPKAKLTRFNDINDCTPSPADYNPLDVKNRAAGCLISGKERFSDDKVDNVSVQSGSSACFRTPTPLKKRRPPLGKQTKIEDDEVLREKTVECINKDSYIQELVDVIEDLKSQVSVLKFNREIVEKDLGELRMELERIEEQYKTTVKALLICYDEEKVKINEEVAQLNFELNDLRGDTVLIRDYYENRLKETAGNLEGFDEKFTKITAKYLRNLKEKETEVVLKEQEIKKRESELKSLECAHSNSLESADKLRRKELEQLQMVIKVRIAKIQEKFLVEGLRDIRVTPSLKMTFSPIENFEDVADPFNSDHEGHQKVDETDLKPENKTEEELEKEEKNLKNYYEYIYISELVEEEKLVLEELEKKYSEVCIKRAQNLEKEKNEKIKKLREQQEIQLGKTKEEHDSHILQIKENNFESIQLAKIQSEEKCLDNETIHKEKLETHEKEAKALLKECEKISEDAIRECEMEREQIQEEIRKMEGEVDERKWNESRCQYENLMREYERSVTEFKMLEEKLLQDITQLDNEKKRYLNENYTYNVTINKMHNTVETLKKRLFESDNDVEQLKSELKVCDTSKLQLEEKKTKLTEELESLTKQNDDLEIQQESTIKLLQNEIKHFEDNIMQTVDGYTDAISKIVQNYKTKLEKSEYDVRELANCLYEQEILNSEAYNLIHLANIEIQDLEKNNNNLQEQICGVKIELAQAKAQIENLIALKQEIKGKLKYEQLQNVRLQENLEKAKIMREETELLTKQINQLQDKNESYYEYCEYYKNKANEYEKEIEEMNNINKCYIDQSKKYEDLLQQCEEMEGRNAELRKLVAENEVLIAPFREQLEAYEYERQTLLTQKCDAENEARVMGLRYAEMLGHQNQKQKIKHIVDLKEKNFNLLKSNQNMDMTIRSQSKTIEKLKAELAMFSKTPKKTKDVNKENVPQENYASPLRDRN